MVLGPKVELEHVALGGLDHVGVKGGAVLAHLDLVRGRAGGNGQAHGGKKNVAERRHCRARVCVCVSCVYLLYVSVKSAGLTQCVSGVGGSGPLV